MKLLLADIAHWLKLTPPLENPLVQGVSIDSRSINPGDLFIALKGARTDGHLFINQAIQKGAAAVLVEYDTGESILQLIVKDCVSALGAIANQWRMQFQIPIIGITGSNGKTTVKEMLGHILRQKYAANVLVTQGNLNNALGVPLTLLSLNSNHRVAVIEMGANVVGEIAYLTRIANPTHGVIINSGYDHIAGFGSREGAGLANGEMLQNMKSDSIAVINGDDPCAAVWKSLAKSLSLKSFSCVNDNCNYQGQWKSSKGGGTLKITDDIHHFQAKLQLLGRHNGVNALAAASLALLLCISPNEIMQGLSRAVPVKGRLQSLPWINGSTLIDDSYNANPSSLEAALDVIAELSGERLLVLGDMAELGHDTKDWHRKAGIAARKAGVTRLYAYGEFAFYAVSAFGKGAEHFTNLDSLAKKLTAQNKPAKWVLIKGSRSMHLDQLVKKLMLHESSSNQVQAVTGVF